MGPFSITLYQPDIAGNTGTILRLAACLGVPVEIVEPAGFDVSDRNLRRAGMDYLDQVRLTRHVDFAAFDTARRTAGRRLVLLTTKATRSYYDVAFAPGDVLLFGRESAGVPPQVHETADLAAAIPMQAGARSLNLAVSVAMVAGEAMRQLVHDVAVPRSPP